ncbi:lysozyme [Novosphingobium sp.]|uniref:lysozyme n=1 Tax=Novosphingobium sp. TaxID=1874826 RepID=UPI00286BA6C4|nr:lysozyme [Novosphingobium sp.]
MTFPLDFFDALRRMKARVQPAPAPLTPEPQPAATSSGRGAVGPSGLALIQRFEGCAKKRKDGRFEAYPDPGTGGDPWTIGWGATGPGITPGAVWTEAECDARLERDLARFARDVSRAIGDAPTSAAQFDALVSFHYNTGAIAKATLTKLHKAGRFDEAAQEFGKWVNAGGKPLTGLIRRRAAEAALYRSE